MPSSPAHNRGSDARSRWVSRAKAADVIVNYLDDKTGADAIVAEIEGLGRQARAVQADISIAADATRLIDTAGDLGGVDLLVNNAGIFPRADFLTLDEAEWDAVLGVNLKGAFLCSQAAARSMTARQAETKRKGAIVNIASAIVRTGTPVGVHYSASKAGLVGLTRATALALAPHGIRVNAVAPGVADTAQPRVGMTEAEIAERVATFPLGEIIQPDDVAATAIFLASDESRQMTGQTLHVNGGQFFD